MATRIKGFWHNYATPVGMGIVLLQYNKLYTSGLLSKTERVNMGIVGGNPPFHDFMYNRKFALSWNREPTRYEYWTLMWMWREAQHETEDCFYWYIHTKGASWLSAEPNGWRNHLDDIVINHHLDCIDAFNDPDIMSAGPLLAYNPHPFYAGNFFWARSSYIKTLLNPYALLDERRGRGLAPELDRFIAEEWITQGIPGKSADDERQQMRAFSVWTGEQPV